MRHTAPNLLRAAAIVVSLTAALSPFSTAGEVEVLHFWTSGGEAKSLQELKDAVTKRGHTWKDFVVKGGGGGNAMAQLRERTITEKNPPAAALIKGPAIQEWAKQNTLTNLDSMAAYDNWDRKLPPVIANQMKYKGRYVAVPVNVHRVNWLWANADVLQKSGITEMPKTMREFLKQAKKVQKAGFIPLAHGGQPWQDFTTFESVALSNGADFYQEALVDLEPSALNSAEMKNTLKVFRALKSFTDKDAPGREWNAATDMLIKGKAAFQFMGDWAKGEFLNAGKKPNKDFFCAAAPGTGNAFSYNVDSFAMFKLRSPNAEKAQGYLAYLIMGSDFQHNFNLRKGSVPANLEVKLDDFDACAQQSHKDFQATSKNDTLLPSIAHGMAVAPAQQEALSAIVSEYWNNDSMTADEAMSKMVAAVQ